MPRFRHFSAQLSLAFALLIAFAINSIAATEQVLHTFQPFGHGGNPQASLIADAAGNLYGTASTGGVANGGVVFKLTPTAIGPWKETILHEFVGGIDGLEPLSGLVFDRAGNLYGTTNLGGSKSCGVVFELSPNADAGWTEHVIHTFTNNNDGAYPQGNLVFDTDGNLYGTTYYGGASFAGSVFELSPTRQGHWTSKLLFEFTGGSDGSNPAGGVVFDDAGNLYGTTVGTLGGINCTSSCGTVFKLAPAASGPWTETTLHTFTGGYDGGNPISALLFDKSGNLYGTASNGGCCQAGVVYELSPSSAGEWTDTIIYGFERAELSFHPKLG